MMMILVTSDTCAPIFRGVRPLLYQFLGSDPELRKWVHRCLTHFCHGLLAHSRHEGFCPLDRCQIGIDHFPDKIDKQPPRLPPENASSFAGVP